jgi:RNA polymerase sigma-70 factor, ECF subfamily
MRRFFRACLSWGAVLLLAALIAPANAAEKIRVAKVVPFAWTFTPLDIGMQGNRSVAEDICQEAFLRSYLNLKELRERERFASWLFRIAVNLYRSYRRRPSPLAAAADLNDTGDSAGEAHPMSREMQLTIRTLISRLKPELREVVLLRFFHGFQFDEMAGILNCPVGTLKSRLYKAVDELRTGLETQK